MSKQVGQTKAKACTKSGLCLFRQDSNGLQRYGLIWLARRPGAQQFI